jgi:hypothetical protein
MVGTVRCSVGVWSRVFLISGLRGKLCVFYFGKI